MYYYKRIALLNLMSLISFVASAAGIIMFFTKPVVTVFCGVFSIVESLLQVIFGEQNSIITEILTIVIAIVIAFIAKLSYMQTIGFALCVVNVLLYIIGLFFIRKG